MSRVSINENCLLGVLCPKCGNNSRFIITALANFEVTDDGAVYDGGAVEYDKDSSCECPDCKYTARFEKFSEDVNV